jgi:hypothetical protein
MLFKRKAAKDKKEKPVSNSKLFSLALAINAELEKLRGTDPKFSGAYAASAGKYISIRYHSTQEPFLLDYSSACRYLSWVKEGHYGRHIEMPK